jgi:hypothetical protein
VFGVSSLPLAPVGSVLHGPPSIWSTNEIAEILGIPESVTQVALLPVGYYTGDDFSPTPRRAAKEITFFNHWKQTID